MESPEVFFQRFISARNALVGRHQRELELLQEEFCQDHHIYDKRLAGFEDERVLDVVNQGTRVEITTNGTTKGKYAKRSRYVLAAEGGVWFIFDCQLECPLCHGAGIRSCSGLQCKADPAESSGKCKVCKGKGWISVREHIESTLDE